MSASIKTARAVALAISTNLDCARSKLHNQPSPTAAIIHHWFLTYHCHCGGGGEHWSLDGWDRRSIDVVMATLRRDEGKIEIEHGARLEAKSIFTSKKGGKSWTTVMEQ